jgi:hypothetical protein
MLTIHFLMASKELEMVFVSVLCAGNSDFDHSLVPLIGSGAKGR